MFDKKKDIDTYATTMNLSVFPLLCMIPHFLCLGIKNRHVFVKEF